MDERIESTFSYIDSHREDMVKYLQKLVRIDTQVPPGLNYDKICEIMESKFSEYGCSVSFHEATEDYLKSSGADFLQLEGARCNIVARYGGLVKHPALHISAHIDTAAIQKEGWTVDPLGGLHTKDNKYDRSIYDKGGGYVWGRGSCDDKGSITAMTYALEALHETGVKLKGDLILTGNCDEEIGGIAGLGFLFKEGIVKADYGIQLDGSINSIGLAAQGRARFLIRIHGKSYHGQMPILGVNAIEKMSKINVALTDYWRNVLLKRQIPVPGVELPRELRSIGIDKLTAMLNIGTIKGGVQGATVPDLCEEEVLRGMVPGESFEEVRRELVSVIEGVKASDPSIRYDIDLINAREGYVVSYEDPYIQKTKRIVEEVLGREVPFTGSPASTDMNYQVNEGEMPCFSIGVGEPFSNVHKPDESVSVDAIAQCAKIIASMIIHILC